MNVRVYEDRSQMGKAAGEDVIRKMKELLDTKKEIRMIFAAAPSQSEMLAFLAKAEGIDWSRVTVFHMDEYIGLPQKAPQRFARFLNDHLFHLVNPGSVHLIDGSAPAETECRRYGSLIKQAAIDIVCLGIGENGHIAFNDPPVADFNDSEVMKKVHLDDICRQQQVNDGCFSSFDEVPESALTLTVPTLMSGSRLFCVVPGKTKCKAIMKMLTGPVTSACPASILRHHADCTLYIDRDAYGDME